MHILECNFDGYASFLFKDAEEEGKWLSPRDRFNLFDGTPRNLLILEWFASTPAYAWPATNIS